MRQKIEANEVPKDPETEKRKFLDEIFGRDFPSDSKMLVEEPQEKKSSLGLNEDKP